MYAASLAYIYFADFKVVKKINDIWQLAITA